MKSLKELEEKTQKDFLKYCQNTKVPLFFWIILIVMGLLAVSFAIQEFFNVGV